MYRAIIISLLCGIVFFAAACGKKDKTGKESGREPAQTQPAATESAVSSGAAAGDSLEEQSSYFAEQIVAGMMDRVWEHFTGSLAGQMPIDILQASWDSVVAGATGYQGVESAQGSESGGMRVVLVTLRYAGNQGKTIRFVYNEQGEIAGIWFDTARLERAATGESVTAVSDYEETEFTVGKEPWLLSGKLTLPVGQERPPVVILLGDGTDVDMDGTVGAAGNKPLRDLAQGLGAQGIASLRYSMRGCQYRDALPKDSGIYDLLLEDIGCAVAGLYNDQRIDRERIYIAAMGNSAAYVPAMVADKPNRIAGAVLMGAKPVFFSQTFYAKKTEEQKTVVSDPKYFIDKNSTFPLLLIQGEADVETDMDDFEQWKALWKGRAHTTYRSFDKLNHYLMPATGAAGRADYDKKGSVNPAVIQTIADWIQEQQ